ACVSMCLSVSCTVYHRVRLSFPTRRSSDLNAVGKRQLIFLLDKVSSSMSETHAALPDDGRNRRYTRAQVYIDDYAHHPEELRARSEEHTSELQSRENLVCRLLLEKRKEEKV